MEAGEGTIPPLLLLGCGQMGGAMLAGWREQGLAASVVVDPAAALVADRGEHRFVASLAEVPDEFRPALAVLAVKPQMAASVLPDLARLGPVPVLSVMAGWTVAGLEGLLGHSGVVRAMPNTPAAIRQGMSVAFAGPGVDARARALCDRLLRAVGAVAWVEEERMLDAVTAISGGGPAYVFLLAELLEREGVAHGLPPALARELARRTVSGSGALLAARPQDAAALRQAVTSPRGTTERALAVLMAEAAWPALLHEAVGAAIDRARALSAG